MEEMIDFKCSPKFLEPMKKERRGIGRQQRFVISICRPFPDLQQRV